MLLNQNSISIQIEKKELWIQIDFEVNDSVFVNIFSLFIANLRFNYTKTEITHKKPNNNNENSFPVNHNNNKLIQRHIVNSWQISLSINI